MKYTRRQILKAGVYAGAGMMLPLRFLHPRVFAAAAIPGLSDPALQPMFVETVPDAMAPGFMYAPVGSVKGQTANYVVGIGKSNLETGLLSSTGATRVRLTTPIWGYGQQDGLGYTWPGRTFEVQSGRPVQVLWENNLYGIDEHLLPVDGSLHWCFSLPGYENYSIEQNGVPVVTHLHGGHSLYLPDGNPEQFFTPGWGITGPRFRSRTSVYVNDQVAGNLWYHDHALGITRLNVYAGLAGFYFIRDEIDTGKPDNPLGLPTWPYEKAYAIQDRMFRSTGQLFYPAFAGDPAYEDFIIGEGATVCGEGESGEETLCLDPEKPTALAEFFGDHMLVNGKIWPKENVEPRHYRMHLLNGCDSRFLIVRFRIAGDASFDRKTAKGSALSFDVIGSDQGLASSVSPTTELVVEPGARYDLVFDFSQYEGQRIIMENIGGDEPLGLEPGEQVFGETDRIMAFDVTLDYKELSDLEDRYGSAPIAVHQVNGKNEDRIRKVALFEGKDEFGRLQPLLGTAEPATDFNGKPILWPDTPAYREAGLAGRPMEGAIPWHSPTSENPKTKDTEIWEIFNVTGDAHPIHLHLVHFDVLGRQEIKWDSNVDEEGFIPVGESPEGDGIYLVTQPVVQHNGELGQGFKIVHPPNPQDAYGEEVTKPENIVENSPKDMVVAFPGQVTRIKVTFDKHGRYVWHCHILSHEDHEMMRVLHVGGGA